MPYGEQIEAVLVAVAHSLGSVDPRWALLAAALHVTHHVLRSLAWRNVLRAAEPGRPVGLPTVAACYAAGVALNAVTPARGGDAAKIALLRTRMPGASVATLASSMSVVLLFDSIVATVLVLGVWGFGTAPGALSLPGNPALVALGVAVLAAAVVVARRHLGPRLRSLLARVRRGGAILRTPRRYLREVVLVQAFAWACRLGVVVCLLAAFDLPASIPLGAAVLVFAGLSSLVPLTPGGAGGQQVLVALALQGAVSTTGAVSFSIGMQAGITLINGALGVLAAMLLFRTLRPWAALRAATAR